MGCSIHRPIFSREWWNNVASADKSSSWQHQRTSLAVRRREAPKSNSPDGGLGYDLKIDEPTLEQNVPNPFSEQTLIRYTLPESAAIQLAVYNQQGQQIEILAEGTLPAGEYQARWNGSHLPSGTYLYVLSVNGQDLVKRAVKMN